ncbi:hypothetical protein D7006_14410 [Xanthobacter sp. YC-JY1]|nr:hypothetical protein D7006_14410 [Xanthobacter sp. YC-JY1]
MTARGTGGTEGRAVITGTDTRPTDTTAACTGASNPTDFLGGHGRLGPQAARASGRSAIRTRRLVIILSA